MTKRIPDSEIQRGKTRNPSGNRLPDSKAEEDANRRRKGRSAKSYMDSGPAPTKKAAVKKTVKKAAKKTVKKKAVKKKAVKKVVKKKAVKKAAPAKKKAVKKTAPAKKSVKKPVSVKRPATVQKISDPASSSVKSAPRRRVKIIRGQTPFIDTANLPHKYDQTCVRLIARDPHWIYTYWEISADAVDEMRRKIGDRLDQSVYTLRVYDISLIEFNGTNAHHYFDFDGLHMGHRYIDLWNDNMGLCCEIGVREPDGTFHALARSNATSTPRKTLSPRHDLIWKEVRDDEESPAYLNLQLLDRRRRGRLVPRNNWIISATRYTLSPEEIELYYSSDRSLIRKHPSGWLEQIRREKQIPEDVEISLEDSAFGPMLVYKFRHLMVGASENRLSEETLYQYLEQIGEESQPGGASEQMAAPYFPSRQEKKDFFFEVETELIVRGRTEPDADVFLHGEKVDLDEQGRFEMRMPLHHGHHPFAFRAQSMRKGLKKDIDFEVLKSEQRES